MSSNAISTNYVSEIDQLLQKLNAELPASATQLHELAMHQQVYALRDEVTPIASLDAAILWEKF
jgi:hypothetical protein